MAWAPNVSLTVRQHDLIKRFTPQMANNQGERRFRDPDRQLTQNMPKLNSVSAALPLFEGLKQSTRQPKLDWNAFVSSVIGRFRVYQAVTTSANHKQAAERQDNRPRQWMA